MFWVRRISIISVFLSVLVFAAWYFPQALDPTFGPEKRARDRRWVNSSPYFWDRQACRWLSICGLHHLRGDPPQRGLDNEDGHGEMGHGELRRMRRRSWEENGPELDSKRNVHDRRRILKDVPDYVLKHAPLIHLYSGEQFWPSDIKEHVEHMDVYVNDEALNLTEAMTLHNMHLLNDNDGLVHLRSQDNVETRPSWLHSLPNVPNPFAKDDGSDRVPPRLKGKKSPPAHRHEPSTWLEVDKEHPIHRITDPREPHQPAKHNVRSEKRPKKPSHGYKPDADGYSDAPAVLIVVDKGSGIVDAFWFFFYSYNLGQTVLGVRFGNHVGDWEHSMVRFENGVPRGMYFSEHAGGQSFAWDAIEKKGDRPVIFSAVGSHAMYALPGKHAYILPFGLLSDYTDRGPLWDPALNNYAYHFDYTAEPKAPVSNDAFEPVGDRLKEPPSLTPASSNPGAPTSWFHFRGNWGDEIYSLADPRQWRLFGQYHYVHGPSGPKFKRLHRRQMCVNKACELLYELDLNGVWYK